MPTRLADLATRSVWDRIAVSGDPSAPVAVGGDLDVATLAGAYRRGIFPWPPGNAEEAADLRDRFGHAVASGAIPNLAPGRPPTLDLPWWNPDPRGVIRIGTLHLPRSLRAVLSSCGWTTTLDTCFADVVGRCGEGRASVWITPLVVDAYARLNAHGAAHSLEVWAGEELVGGLYGVLVGGVFMGESMFHRRSNASKVALADLACRLRTAGAVLIDTQFATAHLRTLGAVEMPRERFLGVLAHVRDDEIRLHTGCQPVDRLAASRETRRSLVTPGETAVGAPARPAE
jgi:leucyl/phenylalanyl-tRNA--protein transferase